MDPLANIERQRELAVDLIAPTWDVDELAAKASELAELVQALDEWRLKGGFDPYDPIDLAWVAKLTLPLEEMRAIVDYSWQSEQRDYEDCQQDNNDNETEGHVFLHLQAVDRYLTERGV